MIVGHGESGDRQCYIRSHFAEGSLYCSHQGMLESPQGSGLSGFDQSDKECTLVRAMHTIDDLALV